ncbi:MAG: phosphatase PAP2 family protein [Candidatus Binatia bacterium]
MTPRGEKTTVALLLAAVVPPAFFWCAAVSGTRPLPPPPWLATPLDRALPVVPASSWLYVSWYAAPLALLWLRVSSFRRAAMALGLGFGVCALGYLAFPVTIGRPYVSGTGLSAMLLRALYSVDPPCNIFPSFHATVATILAASLDARAPIRRAVVGWMAAICVACVLTKQHYVLDVVAGVIVGGASLAVADALGAAVSWALCVGTLAAPGHAPPGHAPRAEGR